MFVLLNKVMEKDLVILIVVFIIFVVFMIWSEIHMNKRRKNYFKGPLWEKDNAKNAFSSKDEKMLEKNKQK